MSGTKAWLGNIRTKQEALSVPGPITSEMSIWVRYSLLSIQTTTLFCCRLLH